MERKTVAAAKPTSRSKVTNGRNLFVDSDGRGAWARRFRDLCALHVEDLGGSSVLSEAQGSLIRRAATLEVELERREGQLAKGDEVDLDAYSRTAGHLRRILETLGIERRQRDVTPSLADLVALHKKSNA